MGYQKSHQKLKHSNYMINNSTIIIESHKTQLSLQIFITNAISTFHTTNEKILISFPNPHKFSANPQNSKYPKIN